jgi:DNA-binding transcriptional ArsR family regulator
MQIVEPIPRAPAYPEVLDHSVVFELSWCLHAAFSEYLRAMHPILDRLYQERDDLRRRVVEFWPQGEPSCVESEFMAFHGGVLDAVDFATYREGCETALLTLPEEPGLASETEEVRLATWDRLRQLRESDTLRRRYFDLLSEIWDYVAPWWDTVGKSAAEQASKDARRRMADGTEWNEMVTAECHTYHEHLPDIIDKQRSGHRVVLVPCALFGRGLYLELPDCTVVGMAASDLVRTARAETQQVVGSLRALADPTRLAIFHSLRSGPTTVGDIAKTFSLAQPTVSMHVKRLREAGLVDTSRKGNWLEITVNQASSEKLAEQLTALLAT